MTAPIVHTQRLILRTPLMSDFAEYAAFVDAPGVDPTDVVIRHDLRGLA